MCMYAHADTPKHVPPANFPFTLQNNKLPISGIIQAEAEWSPVSNIPLKGYLKWVGNYTMLLLSIFYL